MEDNGTPIMAKPDGWVGKLDIASPLLMDELAEVAATLGQPIEEDAYPYRLISRRLQQIHNSNWHENTGQRDKLPEQVAFMNPADLTALSLSDGDTIKVTSARASIECQVQSAEDIRPGCLSVPHGWGGAVGTLSGNTNHLIYNDRDYDKHTGLSLIHI